jgi:multidrug efflux pump
MTFAAIPLASARKISPGTGRSAQDDAIAVIEDDGREEEGYTRMKAAAFAYQSTGYPDAHRHQTAAGFPPIATAAFSTGEYIASSRWSPFR